VIAVSLARFVSQGETYFITSGEDTAKRGLRDWMMEVEGRSHDAARRLGPDIIGILFRGIAPVELLQSGSYVTAQVTNLHTLARVGSLDSQVFTAFADSVQLSGWRCAR